MFSVKVFNICLRSVKGGFKPKEIYAQMWSDPTYLQLIELLFWSAVASAPF